MIQYLHIKNIALVDEIEIEFEKGLNVVTGETGAGKSVIVGSLNFILGERFDSDQIRSGEEKALIEAVFDISDNRPLKNFLKGSGISFDEKEFLVRREAAQGGKGRCFVCGSIVPLGALKTIGDFLVDIHGQHDHQSLLNPVCHTDILDRFGKNFGLRGETGEIFKRYSELKSKRDGLVSSKENRQRELDFLKFQLDEIKKAGLRENEDEILNKEFEILRNAAHLKEISERVYSDLYDAEGSLIGRLGGIESGIRELSKYEGSFLEYLKNFESAACTLKETAGAVQRFKDRIEINEERLAQVEERIVFIESLKKKYGGTLAGVIACGNDLAVKVGSIENSGEELKRIDDEINTISAELKKSAGRLTKKREEAAKKLSLLVKKELGSLGMPQTDFMPRIIPCEIGPDGAERIEIFISPNKGEELKPLKTIASGGEISRVMLAIKKIIADTDEIPALVFDEIDVNIGGRLAKVVGERLKDIAGAKQVICITHLPQIASVADNHLYVEKKVSGGRTVTFIKKLNKMERADEITRMLGGKDGSAAEEYAKELLKG